jgi:hypothetical protein
MNQDKRTWRAPELIDIGNVVDLTEGMGTNVRDNQGQEPPSYNQPNRNVLDEVELD